MPRKWKQKSESKDITLYYIVVKRSDGKVAHRFLRRHRSVAQNLKNSLRNKYDRTYTIKIEIKE